MRHSPESYRFIEALESGCIPITSKLGYYSANLKELTYSPLGYYGGLFNSSGYELHRGILQLTKEQWLNASDLILPILHNMRELDLMWEDIMKWYRKYHESLKQKFDEELSKIC